MSVNTDLLRKTLAHIEAHPEAWEQSVWAVRGLDGCGTALCFAGHAVTLSGLELSWVDEYEDGYGNDDDEYWTPARQVANNVRVDPDSRLHGYSIRYAAADLLGLNDEQAYRLFEGNNTLAELRRIVGELTAEVSA